MAPDFTLNILLDRIHEEAEELKRTHFALSEMFLYLQAFMIVLIRLVKARHLTVRQRQVYEAVGRIQERTQARRGVGRREVVRELELQGVEISEWLVSQTFGELEHIGLLYRQTKRAKSWWRSPPVTLEKAA